MRDLTYAYKDVDAGPVADLLPERLQDEDICLFVVGQVCQKDRRLGGDFVLVLKQ